MTYNYSAYIAVTGTDGRFANFTASPTVTALDGIAEAAIVSPSPTITNLATGVYKVKLAAFATLTDVLWKVEPAAADQATIADIATLNSKVEQVIDERIDVATSTRLASDDARLDNLDAAVSTRATPADVIVSASVSITPAQAAAVSAGELGLRSYTTFTQSVTSTSTDDLSTATSVWLAIKRNTAKADADSLIFIEATDGLTILDGAAYGTPTNGSLTVTGTSGDWTVALRIEAAAMAAIGDRVGSYDAEIKYKLGTNVKVLWSGAAILSDGVVRAIA
jgi:hypothetical protein